MKNIFGEDFKVFSLLCWDFCEIMESKEIDSWAMQKQPRSGFAQTKNEGKSRWLLNLGQDMKNLEYKK